jgi:hypothetical protein
MNYTRPPAAPAGLTYPIEQITVNPTNLQLQKLNTSPFQILPSGFNYTVINANLKYDNINLNTGINLFIGYESLLGTAISSAFCDFDTAFMGLIAGNIGLDTKVRNQLIYATSTDFEPLVLWQQGDDSTATYNVFTLTITYIKFP